MNRKLISKAISDIADGYIAETMSPPRAKSDQAPERTGNMGKFENRSRGTSSRRLMSLVLAACLIFALAVTAYALNLLGIREMFDGPNRTLPEEADAYIQQHTETAALEDWSARITESLCDSSKIMVTVNVSGGDKYILAPTDVMPEDSVRFIGIEGDQTLAEYAAAQGKELLFVGASLMQNEALGIFTEAQNHVSVSAGEMNILVESSRSGGEAAEEAICFVYARDALGEEMNLEVPFALTQTPALAGGEFVPEDPEAVPGITVGNAQVTQSPLGWTVRFMYTKTEEDALYNLGKVVFDEITDFGEGGFVLADDGNWYGVWSMGQGNVTDTLTVHFYDDNSQPMGDIVFRKK